MNYTIAITIGIVAFVLLIILLVWFFMRREKYSNYDELTKAIDSKNLDMSKMADAESILSGYAKVEPERFKRLLMLFIDLQVSMGYDIKDFVSTRRFPGSPHGSNINNYLTYDIPIRWFVTHSVGNTLLNIVMKEPEIKAYYDREIGDKFEKLVESARQINNALNGPDNKILSGIMSAYNDAAKYVIED